MSKAPFPIPYQGSKRKLAPAIMTCVPPDTERLVEPFCGSAAVALHALTIGRVRSVWINDSNIPLARLWQEIARSPEDVAASYSRLWNAQIGREREHYDGVREEFNRTHEPVMLLYLLARCVKAAVRYNSNGDFNQSPDNRRRGSKPERMATHLRLAGKLLADRSTITHDDYITVLSKMKTTDVVYMDPPYQGVSTNRDRRYRDIISFDDFVDCLLDLNRREVSYIISYDGRTGDKSYGKPLPETLHLVHYEIDAGRSTQATFLGQDRRTIESLYISPALANRLDGAPATELIQYARPQSPNLFESGD